MIFKFPESLFIQHIKFVIKRKSSYVNPRGIPPATQQVLTKLVCVWGGFPIQSWWGGGGFTPSSHGGGYLPIQTWPGVPWVPPTIQTRDGVPPTIQTWDGVSPHHPDLGWGIPPPHHPDLGWGTLLPSRSGMGYPPVIRPGMGYPPPPSRPGTGYPAPPPPIQTWDGVPPPPPMVNRQTFPSINITFPRTTFAGGNKNVKKYVPQFHVNVN